MKTKIAPTKTFNAYWQWLLIQERNYIRSTKKRYKQFTKRFPFRIGFPMRFKQQEGGRWALDQEPLSKEEYKTFFNATKNPLHAGKSD